MLRCVDIADFNILEPLECFRSLGYIEYIIRSDTIVHLIVVSIQMHGLFNAACMHIGLLNVRIKDLVATSNVLSDAYVRRIHFLYGNSTPSIYSNLARI